MDDGYMVLTFEAWARLAGSVKVEGDKVLIPRTVWEGAASVEVRKRRKRTRIDAALKARVAELAEENPRMKHWQMEQVLGVYHGYINRHKQLSSIVQAARVYRSRRQVEESGDCSRDWD